MANFVEIGGLKVNEDLYHLVSNEIAPGTGVEPDVFWKALSKIVQDLGPKNRALLDKRNTLQKQIDDWCVAQRGRAISANDYKAFLTKVGYLVPEGKDFEASTARVDREISEVSGPQLVVPLDNARYALNAANARWGSLYDALYGTDVISETDGCERSGGYNPRRGLRVIAMAREFLDQAAALAQGSHKNAVNYTVAEGALVVELADGTQTGLAEASKFAGYAGEPASPHAVLLRNHGLHLELQIDSGHPVGRADPAGVKDVLLEAALT